MRDGESARGKWTPLVFALLAVMEFDFELSDAAQIRAILQVVRDIDGVYEADRVLPDAG